MELSNLELQCIVAPAFHPFGFINKFLVLISFISVCAPTESLFVVVYSPERRYQVDGLLASGFMCSKCSQGGYRRCLNCSLCSTGTYSSRDRANTNCLRCPAGKYDALYVAICFWRHLRLAKNHKMSVWPQWIEYRSQMFYFQEAFTKTKWAKLTVRTAPLALMFLRLTTLENLRLTVVHALTVRENNKWNWVLIDWGLENYRKVDFLLPLFIKQVPNLTNLLVIVHAVVSHISSA